MRRWRQRRRRISGEVVTMGGMAAIVQPSAPSIERAPTFARARVPRARSRGAPGQPATGGMERLLLRAPPRGPRGALASGARARRGPGAGGCCGAGFGGGCGRGPVARRRVTGVGGVGPSCSGDARRRAAPRVPPPRRARRRRGVGRRDRRGSPPAPWVETASGGRARLSPNRRRTTRWSVWVLGRPCRCRSHGRGRSNGRCPSHGRRRAQARRRSHGRRLSHRRRRPHGLRAVAISPAVAR